MLKYAKIIDQKKKICEVGLGSDEAFYISLGMQKMDVERGYDNLWYIKGFIPTKPEPGIEEIEEMRRVYRLKNCDQLTCRKIRKTAMGLWTEEDEKIYLNRMQEIETELDQKYPIK